MSNERVFTINGKTYRVSEEVWKLSPELQKAAQGHVDPPGRLPDSERAQPAGSLGQSAPKRPPSKRRLVICVEIIALRNRSIDDDNLIAGAKHLRDCIATSLGLDDKDKRFRWRYGFCQTEGREQTIVRVSLK